MDTFQAYIAKRLITALTILARTVNVSHIQAGTLVNVTKDLPVGPATAMWTNARTTLASEAVVSTPMDLTSKRFQRIFTFCEAFVTDKDLIDFVTLQWWHFSP